MQWLRGEKKKEPETVELVMNCIFASLPNIMAEWRSCRRQQRFCGLVLQGFALDMGPDVQLSLIRQRCSSVLSLLGV